jgi:hypothetical protein
MFLFVCHIFLMKPNALALRGAVPIGRHVHQSLC